MLDTPSAVYKLRIFVYKVAALCNCNGLTELNLHTHQKEKNGKISKIF